MSKYKSIDKIACAAALAVASLSGIPKASHAAIVINEVYGGGGSSNSAASYQQDFCELYNNGSAPVDVTGYVVRYASATGTFPSGTTSASYALLQSYTIPAGGYFLVAGGANSTSGGSALPTPNFQSGFQAAQSTGKFQLLDASLTPIDLVGYGTATTFEGTGPAPAPGISTSDSRTNGIDTDSNPVDFTLTSPPTPTAGAIPEPTSLGLAAAAALLICRRRR